MAFDARSGADSVDDFKSHAWSPSRHGLQRYASHAHDSLLLEMPLPVKSFQLLNRAPRVQASAAAHQSHKLPLSWFKYSWHVSQAACPTVLNKA